MFKKIVASPFLVFPLMTCIVFWPLSLQLFTLKNDALTYYYPVRTLISDALNNGELPLWTPFINMGYPLHADMQSGAWNPVIWAFAFLTDYNLAAFHYELVLYLSFGGIGFYYLCRQNKWTVSTAFSLGFAYELSGFMIDSVQFFACISAACYIPFIFLFFKKLIRGGRPIDALLTALFLYLLFSGGYPSLFIITSYFLLAYMLFIFVGTPGKMKYARQMALPLSLCVITFLLLSLPVVISYVQHLPFLARGNKQSLDFVLENSMPPLATFSLISPFSTTAHSSWLQTDPLMRNAYIGLIPLFFLIYGFWNKSVRKIKEVQFLFITAILMFGLAFGSHFFLRQVAYYLLPLMNTFRHPALFRLFGIFCLLLVTGYAINEWQQRKDQLKNAELSKITIAFSLGALALSIFIFVFRNAEVLGIFKTGPADFKSLFTNLSFYQRYLFQIPVILFIAVVFYWMLRRKKSFVFIMFLCLVDLVAATQFNIPVTVIGARSFSEVERSLNRNTDRFPLPGKTSIETNSLNSIDGSGLTGSTLPFQKKIGRNDYYITPGNLSSQEQFYDSPETANVFKHPPIFYSDTLAVGDITVKKFTANSLDFTSKSNLPGSITYLQNYYPGWKAFVDGKQVNVIKTLTTFMKVDVEAGQHLVTFQYAPTVIKNTWYISIFTLAAIILFLLSRLIFSRNHDERNP